MCDPGTFQEIGSTSGVGSYDEDGRLVGFQPANLLCGVADVDGRPCVVSGDDFTVRGGSSEATIPEKRAFAEQIAIESGCPTSASSTAWAAVGRSRTSRPGAHLRAQDQGLGVGGEPPGGGAVGGARPRLGGRHRRAVATSTTR